MIYSFQDFEFIGVRHFQFFLSRLNGMTRRSAKERYAGKLAEQKRLEGREVQSSRLPDSVITIRTYILYYY